MTDPLPEITRLREQAFVVSVSADRPMEVQFDPLDGPGGGFTQLHDAERAVRDADARARREERERLTVARLVADHWRKGLHQLAREGTLISARAGAHSLCMVLAALDGETHPQYLGITPDSSEWGTLAALIEQGEPDDA